jgi:hypothetical protein
MCAMIEKLRMFCMDKGKGHRVKRCPHGTGVACRSGKEGRKRSKQNVEF